MEEITLRKRFLRRRRTFSPRSGDTTTPRFPRTDGQQVASMSNAAFGRIESERLILRRYKDSDLDLFVAYRNDPEVARYQSWDSFDKREARAFIREMASLQPGVPGDWFQFAVVSKEAGELVGDCALQVDGQEPYRAELGFTLAREHQGKGFASEAVSRLLDYAFASLDLHRIFAIADCRNKPSWRLLERVGLRQEGHFLENVWFKGEWSDEYMYAVLKDEWLGRRPD
jgi:RimJ/RimL family protein N-acetyltransferase